MQKKNLGATIKLTNKYGLVVLQMFEDSESRNPLESTKTVLHYEREIVQDHKFGQIDIRIEVQAPIF